MINRKRYYNSFFDQIVEYKQHKHSSHESSHSVYHQLLGAGLVGSVLMVALVGGFGSLSVPALLGRQPVAYFRSETRPALDFANNLQETDASFASELSGDMTIPTQDAYTDVRNVRVNFGFDAMLRAGGAEQARTFMQFDLTKLESKEDLVLKLYPTADFTGTINVFSASADELWEEDTLTAESAPRANGVQLSRASGTFGPDVTVDFDLRDAFTEMDSVLLVVTATGSRDGFAFYSREGIRPPELRSVR